MSEPAPDELAALREQRGRSLDRALSFSDAVMSIALTLLVLPLVDIATDNPAESILDQLDRSGPQVLGFLVSFLVISQFWGAHRRLWDHLGDYDERLLAINTFWLLLVVFLPYPTARLFAEDATHPDSAIFYLLVLFGVSALMLAEAWYVARHPWLRRSGDRRSLRDQIRPAAGTTAVFALAIVLALISRSAGLYSLLLLLVVQRFTTQKDQPLGQPRPDTQSIPRKNRLP
ncbi:TMEM175 family protein [Asanoa sp. NPDC049573]|uniref:TMEM175 family protein n=1 Tax=Asanoa sp. NPDC049573 TaxID=3155396 RepID=UPI003421ED44